MVRNTTHGDQRTGLHLVGPFRFIGGLHLSRWQYVGVPFIEFCGTTDALTFRVRFGLGPVSNLFFDSWSHFVNPSPWIFRREDVAQIQATEAKFFDFLGLGVDLRMFDGRHCTFWSHNRDLVLIRLHQLGYPGDVATLVSASVTGKKPRVTARGSMRAISVGPASAHLTSRTGRGSPRSTSRKPSGSRPR